MSASATPIAVRLFITKSDTAKSVSSIVAPARPDGLSRRQYAATTLTVAPKRIAR
jgi:hypothetical protein